jgi:hypothetical protein
VCKTFGSVFLPDVASKTQKKVQLALYSPKVPKHGPSQEKEVAKKGKK